MSEEKAQLKVSASKVKWLLGEIPGWVTEGLISREAADKISERYRLAQAASGREKLIYAVGILAALLLGTGVIMFFASNWQAIPRLGKLAIICVVLAATYWAGYELKYKRGYEIVGEAIILLGAILFGAGIFLVAQAFHISAHFPNGLLLWMFGLAPLFYLIKSKPLLMDIALLFCVWLIVETVAAHGLRDLGQRTLFIRTGFGFFVLIGLLRLIYKYGAKANAILIIPSILIWLTVFLNCWFLHEKPSGAGHLFLMYIAFFLAFAALSVLHREDERLPPFGTVYQGFSLPAISFGLYVLTFPEFVKELIEEGAWALPVVIGIAFIVFLVAIWFYLNDKVDRDAEPYAMAEMNVYMALSFFVIMLMFLFAMDGSEIFVGMLANLVLFGFIIALIVIGYRGGYPRLINFAIVLFIVDFITRYFDWFWDLLPRSLFFIAGGLVLLVGGIWLEKRRKEWVFKAREAGQ